MASEPETPAELQGNGAAILGERLRHERAARRISLRELARRVDVSPSLVSQIETSKIQPSVRTLYAIVSELGLSFDAIFAAATPADAGPAEAKSQPASAGPTAAPPPAEDDRLVQRAATRRVIELESGIRWERLTPCNDPEVEFLYAVYRPGAESAASDALVRHNGREFGLVLSGRLGVTVGFDEHVLEAGDSILFDSSVPHRLHNDGADEVHAIWVVVGGRAR